MATRSILINVKKIAFPEKVSFNFLNALLKIVAAKKHKWYNKIYNLKFYP